MKNISLLQHLVNKPLYMQQAHAASLITTILAEEQERDLPSERRPRQYARWYRHPDYEHVGVLPINDVLYHGDDYYYYGQSYSSIKANLEDMQSDGSITAIATPHNCYGGTAAGCGSTEQFITENITKPVYSLVDEAMYSASMYIASPSDEIYTLPSAGNGSIGTIIQHLEISKMLEKQGVNFTPIRSGSKKAKGGRMEKLDKATEKEMQEEVDLLASQFMQAVSEHRGISVDEISSFEGGTFTGQKSVEVGLADHLVNTPEDFYLAVAEGNSPAPAKTIHLPTTTQDMSMPKGTTAPAQPAGNEGADKVFSEEEAKLRENAAVENFKKELADKEREKENQRLREEAAAKERSDAILNSEAGKANPTKAAELVADADYTAELAVKTLAMLPPEGSDEKTDFHADLDKQPENKVGQAFSGSTVSAEEKDDAHLYGLVLGFVEGEHGADSEHFAVMKDYASTAMAEDKTLGKKISNRASAALGEK